MDSVDVNSETAQAEPFGPATVADAMHTGIVTCALDTPLAELAALMVSHRLHCLPVVRPSHDGLDEPFVWGIVSDQDVIAAVLEGAGGKSARDVASGPVLAIRPSMPLRDAARLMSVHGVAHAIVISPARATPVGVLSTLDLLGCLGGAATTGVATARGAA